MPKKEGDEGDQALLVELPSQAVRDPGEGTDAVNARISLTLAANTENVILKGPTDLRGTAAETATNPSRQVNACLPQMAGECR